MYKKGTVKLSIFLMLHMHKLWTMAACIFVGRSDSERVSNSGSTLGRQRCLCNHAPIEGSLSSRAFHRKPFRTEKEKDGKEGDQGRKRERERVQREGEEKCFCSPERSSPILTVNKHGADEERRC